MMQNEELKKADIISCLEGFFKRNAKHFHIEMAFLFGSRAQGFPREDSDIDIGVVFNNDALSDKSIFLDITDISLRLLKLTNFDVNIIPIYMDFRKPLLYYNIIVLGKLLYVKDYNKYIVIKNEAIFQMEDFCIFGEKWKMEIAKKKLEEVVNA